MNIDISWDYEEVVKNLKALKNQYQEILTSFYYVKDENNFIREVKKKVYSWKFDEIKIDRIWEYFNDDLTSIEIILYFKIFETGE